MESVGAGGCWWVLVGAPRLGWTRLRGRHPQLLQSLYESLSQSLCGLVVHDVGHVAYAREHTRVLLLHVVERALCRVGQYGNYMGTSLFEILVQSHLELIETLSRQTPRVIDKRRHASRRGRRLHYLSPELHAPRHVHAQPHLVPSRHQLSLELLRCRPHRATVERYHDVRTRCGDGGVEGERGGETVGLHGTDEAGERGGGVGGREEYGVGSTHHTVHQGEVFDLRWAERSWVGEDGDEFWVLHGETIVQRHTKLPLTRLVDRPVTV
mmetsp:Transcript_25774/g.55833  ORF Transcript_25774/g.55833 Transcript_25774/m.55833 type:complete len:268 (+) Transcript_25774:46-849(+)